MALSDVLPVCYPSAAPAKRWIVPLQVVVPLACDRLTGSSGVATRRRVGPGSSPGALSVPSSGLQELQPRWLRPHALPRAFQSPPRGFSSCNRITPFPGQTHSSLSVPSSGLQELQLKEREGKHLGIGTFQSPPRGFSSCNIATRAHGCVFSTEAFSPLLGASVVATRSGRASVCLAARTFSPLLGASVVATGARGAGGQPCRVFQSPPRGFSSCNWPRRHTGDATHFPFSPLLGASVVATRLASEPA